MQLVLAVVAPDQHLEHRLALGDAAARAARRGTGRSARGSPPARRCARRGPARRASAARAASSSRTPASTLGALRVDQRLVEPAEPDAAGEVADDREAQLGGDDQPVEHARGPASASSPSGGGSAIQRCSSEVASCDLGGRALLGEEDAEDRLLELGRALEVGRRRSARRTRASRSRNCLGQAAALDVEALQVGVEVLARAVHAQLGVPLLVGRAGCGSARRGRRTARAASISSAERTRARRRRARRGPRGSRQGAGRRRAGRGRSRAASRRRSREPRADPARRRRPAGAASGRSRSAPVAGASSAAASASSPIGSRRTSGAPVSTWLPVVTSSSGPAPANGACSTVSIFMLSSTSTGAPAATSSPTGDGGRDDERRRGRAQHAALVAADPVGDAVDLDERGPGRGWR